MSRYLKGLALIGLGMLLLALVQLGVGSVVAQSPVPEFAPWRTNSEEGVMPWRAVMGRGMGAMHQNIGSMGQGMGNMHQNMNAMHQGRGMMHANPEEMHAAIAEALGISVAEFEAAHAEGKSVSALAEELGLDIADVRAAMQAVHAEAVAQAVAEGLISEEQAAWMQAHHAQMLSGQGGAMMGRSQMRGMMGQGFGGHHGECPFAEPVE
jgi:hypothetical protein